MNWFIDLAVVLPALLFGLATQWWVRRAMRRADRVPSSRGEEARRVAQRLLASAAVAGVSVEESPDGELSDHYDGRQRVIRLADPESASIAAIAVVAHEVGHAVQHAERSGAFRVRAALAPAASIASAGWLILAAVAILSESFGLLHVAVLLFATVVVFHIVTLPVEIQASRKALEMVRAGGLATPAEERLVRRVLIAAALTYVAAALISIVQLLDLMEGGDE